MYWLRTSPGLELIAWLLLSALWAVGGWLLSTHLFRLRSRERLLTGLAIGLLLFIAFANLLANFISISPAYWGAAGAILVMGLLAAWQSETRPIFDIRDLKPWPLLLALVGLTALFTLTNRGLAIFDDYHNLPLVSTIAAGDVPPHYFINSGTLMAFHYAQHLFAASMVRLGGFSVWSSLDITKAFSLSLSVVLAYLWFFRTTRHQTAGFWGSLLALLGGGSRWLLVLIPAGLLSAMTQDMQVLGSTALSGSDLPNLLRSPWLIEGDGPVPFPLAFTNGIFPPQVMALGASGALPTVALFLLLLLARRRWDYVSGALFGFLLVSLSLAAEHIFVLIWAGLALVLVIGVIQERRITRALPWAWILALSMIVSVAGGGTLTEIVRGRVIGLLGIADPELIGFGVQGFGLRWPPSLISAHLGPLSFSSPGQMLVALAEIGVVIILAPWVTWWCWKRLRQGDWFTAGLGAAALMGFLIPMFVRYLETDRDIVRLASAGLLIWLILGYPLAWFAARKGSSWRRVALGGGYAVLVLGGLALFAVQMAAIPRPKVTNFVDRADMLISRAYWDELPTGAEILDDRPYRGVTLFGRTAGRAQSNPYLPFPEWRAMVDNPDLEQVVEAGYSYIYIDQRWWRKMTPEGQESFKEACVKVLAEEISEEGGFRRLLDVSECE